jgi:PPOX class probable F420-dependent enzyme
VPTTSHREVAPRTAAVPLGNGATYDRRVSQPTHSVELRGEGVLADQLVQELLAARLIGVVATIEPDGSVHAVPMWLAPSDGAILLATGSRSRKVRNLERDPRATLVLHDSRPGADVCGTSMRGRVELVRGESARPLVERVHRRYVSDAGLRLPEVRDFLSSDDVAVRFIPEAAVTWDERPSAAARALRAVEAALPLEPTTRR